MTRRSSRRKRRTYSDELKADVVQMVLDGRSAPSVASNLGLSGAPLLYRWKAKRVEQSGPTATALEHRVREREAELRRVERERDILEKALAISARRCSRGVPGDPAVRTARSARVRVVGRDSKSQSEARQKAIRRDWDRVY